MLKSNIISFSLFTLLACGTASVFADTKGIKYTQGELLFSHDFNDGQRKLWTGGKVVNGVLSLATPANAGHGATARLSSASDWIAYNTDEKRQTAAAIVPNDITNSIIEFDFMLVRGNKFNLVIDDVYANKYTHAGHICRVQIATKFFKIEDDIGGQFGLRQIEKTQNKAEFASVKSLYYPEKHIVIDEKHSLSIQKWYSVRLVMLDTKMALYMGEQGANLKLLAVLDSPGQVAGYLPQPTVAHAAKIGRDNKQPRGLDHFKSKWGFTTPQEGETLFDNIRIYAVAKG